jgi:hypothetical protein
MWKHLLAIAGVCALFGCAFGNEPSLTVLGDTYPRVFFPAI